MQLCVQNDVYVMLENRMLLAFMNGFVFVSEGMIIHVVIKTTDHQALGPIVS